MTRDSLSRSRRRLFITSCVLLVPYLAWAQNGDEKVLQLERRIEQLEKSVQTQSARPLLTGFGDHKLGLILQLRAIHDDNPGVKDEFNGRRAELKLQGSLVPERISYALMIDPIALANRITQDAYLDLTYIPYADFRFGQYKFPQSLEGRWSSGDLDFVRRAAIVKAFADRRDIGAQLSASNVSLGSAKAEYAFGVFNGSGRNVSENNEHKDLAARAGAEWRGLWLGANGYLGKEPTGNRRSAGVEIRFVRGPGKLQAEYLTGEMEMTGGGPSTKPSGYYVLANYLWKSLRPGVRWESFDPDRRVSNDRQDALTAGLDWMLTQDRKNKISFNYTAKFEQGTSVNNDEALLQFQVSF